MSLFIGRKNWLGIAIESNPGVPVSPVDYLPFTDCDLSGKMSPIPELQARGIRDEQGENSRIGKKWGAGTLKTILDPTLAPYLLGLAMGDFGTPVSQGDGVYLHTFTRKADNTPKTASLTYYRGVDQQLFTYSVINSLELAFSDGMVDLSADVISRFPVNSVSGTLTTTSGVLFTFRDANIKFGSDLTEAVSGTELKIRDFSLKIENNSEQFFVVGNNDVDSIANKKFAVNGKFSLNFENTDQRDIFRNLTKKAMIVTFTGNGIGGGLNEFVKIRIAKMRFENYTPKFPLDDVETEEIDFVGEYSSIDAKTLDIQVQNRKSSYE